MHARPYANPESAPEQVLLVYLEAGDYFRAKTVVHSDLTVEDTSWGYDLECTCRNDVRAFETSIDRYGTSEYAACEAADCGCDSCHGHEPRQRKLASPSDILTSITRPGRDFNTLEYNWFRTAEDVGLYLAKLILGDGRETTWEYCPDAEPVTARLCVSIPDAWRMLVLQSLPPDVLFRARAEVGPGMVFPPEGSDGVEHDTRVTCEARYLIAAEPWAAAAVVLNSAQEETVAVFMREMGGEHSTTYDRACIALVRLELSSAERRAAAVDALPECTRSKLADWAGCRRLLPSARSTAVSTYDVVTAELQSKRSADPRWTPYLRALRAHTEAPLLQLQALKAACKAGEIKPGVMYQQELRKTLALWGWQ